MTGGAARKAAKLAVEIAKRYGQTDACDRRRWSGHRASVILHNGWGGVEVALDGQTVISTAWASGEVRLHPGAHPEQLHTLLRELRTVDCPLCGGAGHTREGDELVGCTHPIHREVDQ